MGGRGGSSGLTASGKSKGKYDYPGIKEATQKAEQKFAQLKRDQNKFSALGINKRVSEIVKYIDGQINVISKELASPDTKYGDEKVLYTERRKLRELRSRVLDFGRKH